MPLPTVVAEGLLNLATSKTVQDLTVSVWSKVFRKEAPAAIEEPDRVAEIVELVEQAATRDELATAFASLEARLTAVAVEHHRQIDRRIILLGTTLGVLFVVSFLVLLLVAFRF